MTYLFAATLSVLAARPAELFSTLLLFQLHPETMAAVFMLIVVVGFFSVLLTNRIILRRQHTTREETLSASEILQKAFKISNDNVVEFDIRQNYINKIGGHLLPEGGLSVEEWKSHVHPDDIDNVVESLLLMIDGKLNSAEFNYRWNLDYSGGKPRWAYLHNRSIAEYREGEDKPAFVISTLTDETKLLSQQAELEQLSNKYKQIFENSIVGMSFYSPDGWLLAANEEMRTICNFDTEFSDDYFSKTNLFDTAPFNEIIDRNNVEEFWACSLSVVPERGMYVFLEIRLRPVRDEQGTLVYIALTVRDVTEERKLYLQVRSNEEEIQKANEAIQLYETELNYMMAACDMEAWSISLERRVIEFYNGLSSVRHSIPLSELPTIFVDQEAEFVRQLKADPASAISRPLSYSGQMRPVVTGKMSEPQWVQLNSVPEYDKKGRLVGSFGVWRNITSLMQKQDQLRLETARANDSGHQKSVFLANMTHEIRTPLNAIVGFSDLLQIVEDQGERREMIRIIHNNCDMLLRLINDILILSNVDANVMVMTPEEVDFAREFDELCRSLEQRVSEPGVVFVKDSPCESLVVTIDNRRIQQVITNFVTNAVKYTHQGHIRLGYRPEQRSGQQGLYVYCEDTGSGIPKEELNRVFERFVKLNDFIQGTGLGLSICKAIIERCNGEIGVESEVEKGSTFWFWIPV